MNQRSPQYEEVIQSEFKCNVCKMKDVPSPEMVAQPSNQKYIFIKATYGPILYTRILPKRLKRRENQITGSKISNPLV